MLLFTGTTLASQDVDGSLAHVAVLPFANGTGVSSYDAACDVVTKTLVLTLRELGRYSVQNCAPLGTEPSNETLGAAADAGRVDYMLYGTISFRDSGTIACELSLFDKGKGGTTISSREEADGLLDLFDATDRLIVSVLESMSGRHIGFGSISLTNRGETGEYRVLVDGVPVGSDLQNLDKVLYGQRIITIVQERMFGEVEIARLPAEVKEGEALELDFAIPYLLDDEKARVESLRKAILSGWDSCVIDVSIDSRLAELSSLLADISYSQGLSTLRDDANELSAEWILRKNRLALERSAWTPDEAALDEAALAVDRTNAIKAADKLRDNARFLLSLFDLAAGNALSVGDYAGAVSAFEGARVVSSRYLGGERDAEYTYAAAALKDAMALSGTGRKARLTTVFGPWMTAGKKFYALRRKVEAGKLCLLIGSDPGASLSAAGGKSSPTPFSLTPMTEAKTLSVGIGGESFDLRVAAGEKLLFVYGGSPSFGRLPEAALPKTIPGLSDQGVTTSSDLDARLADLLDARKKAQAQLALKQSRNRGAAISVFLGIVSVSGAALSYNLGETAYDEYYAATNQEAADKARDTMETCGTLFPVSIGIGAACVVSTAIILWPRSDSDSTDATAKSLKATIMRLDAQIENLQAQTQGSHE